MVPLIRFSLYLVLILGICPALISAAALTTYTVGVLDNKGNATTSFLLWQPTFETYTNYHLERLGADFRLKLVALPFHNLTRAVSEKKVDFTFSNTGHSAILGVENGMLPIASIENLRLGHAQPVFGGSAFTWNGSGITTLADCGLPAHRENLAAVSALSFGGYSTQMRELADVGVDIDPIIATMTFTGNHEDSLRLCNEKQKSCCFVRTDKFESNQIKRPHLVNNLVHLSPKSGLEYSFFPFKISTQLYPEWVVSAQSFVDQKQMDILAVILFATKPEDDHATHASYSRWVAAADLSKVRDCLYASKVLIPQTDAPLTLPPSSKGDNTTLIVVTTTLIGAVALIVGGIAVATYVRAQKAVKHAPKKPPLAMVFTDIESSTHLWENHGSDMAKAVDIHHEVIRSCIDENNCYEVKVVGDSFMFAAESLIDATNCCLSIQQRLMEAKWPDSIKYWKSTEGNNSVWFGLRVRMGVHFCTEVDAKFDMVHGRYDYYGHDVNVAARVQAVAAGGQILMTEETYHVLQGNSDFDEMIASDAFVQKFCSGHEMNGVSEPVTLFSIIPQQLSARCFQPIPGTVDETAVGTAEDSFSQSSLSSAGGSRAALRLLRHLFSLLPTQKEKDVFLNGFLGGTKVQRGKHNSFDRRLLALAAHMAQDVADDHPEKSAVIPMDSHGADMA